ncbi:MAG: sugar kinase [Deltaproteobacteria bacterium]|nr:sugar kinase [Deltaproteobacteria bacterium]
MQSPNLVVVGSVAYDSIETPSRSEPDVLGGSATYFSLAASHLARPGVVAVVGQDFRKDHVTLLQDHGIRLDGLETAAGETFRWGGRYDKDLKERDTLFTHLNVFAQFSPRIPQAFRDAPYLFLANIDPDLQHQVLDQCTSPRWVACDTMNFWITGKLDSLLRLLPKIDALFLNDSEAFELTGHRNLLQAARWIQARGPATAVIKKGEHGAILVSRDQVFAVPAFLLDSVADPTGAGDTFAGGMASALAALDDTSPDALRYAAAMGTVMASFCVEDFGPFRLARLTREEIAQRLRRYRELTRIPEMSL